MGGIIQGFLGGAASGMADAGKLMLVNQMQQERDEANDLRARVLQKNNQEFKSGMEDKRIKATIDRDDMKSYNDSTAADKKVETDAAAAKTKANTLSADIKYQVDNKPAKNPQIITRTDNKGFEQDYVLNIGKDGSLAVIDPTTNKPLSDSEVTELKLTKSEKNQAAAYLNTKDGGDKAADFIPFNEATDNEISVEAQKRRGGIVNSVNGGPDINRNTPAVNMPAPKQSAPKAALEAVAKDDKLLPQFIKKYGYDPTKQ